jgi:hypothetical protein
MSRDRPFGTKGRKESCRWLGLNSFEEQRGSRLQVKRGTLPGATTTGVSTQAAGQDTAPHTEAHSRTSAQMGTT